MPRKTTPIELAGGKGKRQRIWEAIRRLAVSGEPFTETMIYLSVPRDKRADIEMECLRDYRRCLLAGGVLKVHREHTTADPATYLLVEDVGIDAPRFTRAGQPVTQGLGQEAMWRTLRMHTGDINASELAGLASTTAVPVTRVSAAAYIKHLHRGGYLILTKEGKGLGNGGVLSRYRLHPGRNTGPRPPMVCRTKVLWDPNENKIVWQPPVSEEDAINAKA